MDKYDTLISNARRKVTKGRKRSAKADTSSKLKQQKLTDSIANANMVTQAKVDDLIFDFIEQGLLPLNTVMLPAFRDLIHGLQPNRAVMDRKTLRNLINSEMKDIKAKLVVILKNQKFVATTTDCWSAFGKGYIGVAIHWIDSKTLVRKSACLALRRLKGSYTFDVIAQELEKIHKEYRIDGRIVRTTTDSGSNFVKAFTVFGEKTEVNVEREEDEDSDLDHEDLSGTEAFDVADTFEQNQDSDEYFLPRHQRCSCHLLNLIATKDSLRAETDAAYKKLSRAAFAKCNALWNKFDRSSKTVETVNDTLGLGLKRPNQTRWNSTFMAVERLVKLIGKNGEETFQTVCEKLDVSKFSRNELTFLHDYVKAMGPLAKALNILQSQMKMYMGYLAPTISKLREMLVEQSSAVSPSPSTCKPLLHALIDGLDSRFSTLVSDPETIAAAILHPKFKTSWTEDQNVIEAGTKYVRATLRAMAMASRNETEDLQTADNAEIAGNDDDNDNNFFKRIRRPVSNNFENTNSVLQQFLSSTVSNINLVASNPLIKSCLSN